MKVLLTGGAGYVGSVLTNILLQNEIKLRVIDKLWFDNQVPIIHFNNPNYEFIHGDALDESQLDKYLEDIDYVIHPAAVVGDPASKKYPQLTRETNEEGSIKLIDHSIRKGIKGFIFFSTCSNYGVSNNMATEESELRPLSLYAETKVNVERYLMDKVNNIDFVILRLSTVYGTSPRMRFDLTVNDFALNGFKKKYIDIFLPESYRPYVHTYDISNIVLNVLMKFNSVKNNVFNVGFNGENYQKIQIANAVKKYIPDLKIDILKEGGDKRDYQVDFSKLDKYLGIKKVFDVDKGVKEILDILNSGIIKDYDLAKYYNTEPKI